MNVVVVEWLSLKETGADEQGNQLTAEENHDCCLLHKTLKPNELMMAVGSWQSFIESRGEKNETSRRRIENNRNVVAVVVVVLLVEENNRNVLVVVERK